MRSSPQDGMPLDGADGVEGALAQIVALHADEPLFGGAKDSRIVAAPTVRITVLDFLQREQSAARIPES